MKLIEGAAHCAIAAGCLAVVWAVFWFASDSPWGIALLGVWIVLVIMLVIQAFREPLAPSRRPLGEDGEPPADADPPALVVDILISRRPLGEDGEHLALDGAERIEAVRVEGAPGRIEEHLRGRPVEPHDPA